MKVNQVNLLIRPGNERLADLSKALKGVNPGEVVPAKVLRIVKGAAILQIFGVRVRAEFPHGLPVQGESLNLLLKSKGAKGFLFSMSSQGRAGMPRELHNLTLPFREGINYHELAKLVKTSSFGVFEIFSHVMGRVKNSVQRDRRRSELYNKMILRGLSPGATSFLSRMSLRGSMPLFLGELLHSLSRESNEFNGGITAERELESFFKDGNSDLLESYLHDFMGEEETGQGEFLLCEDDGTLSRARYLFDENSAVVEVELSVLGRIVVALHKMEESLSLSFYGKGATLEALRARARELNDTMADLGLKKVEVFYSDIEKFVQATEGWARDFYSKSNLDVRV